MDSLSLSSRPSCLVHVAQGREEQDFTDAGSISESDAAMKSSSSEALEDFRPFFTGDFLNLVSL